MFFTSEEARERLRQVQAVAMDLDGTTYLGDQLLEGARTLFERLRGRGMPFAYVTNNSSKSKVDYWKKLRSLGLEVALEEVITSGEATVYYLRECWPRAKVFLVGTPALEEEFRQGGIMLTEKPEEAEVAVLAFDTTITYQKIKDLCDLVRGGVFYVATHPDKVCPVPGGALPDIGAFIALVEAATGRRPDEIIGKPSRRMVEALCQRLRAPKDRIAFIGDRLYTDIAMAREAHMVGILVLTGETRPEDLENSPLQPDVVAQSVEEVAAIF